MFLFQQKNYHLIVLGLALMLVIPCSVKQDIKQKFTIENQQRTANAKTSCQSVREFDLSYKKSVEKKTGNSFISDSVNFFSFLALKQLLVLDIFNSLKEFIPTYLLHQSFLI